MIKFPYVLMTKGKKKMVNILGNVAEVDWNVVFYSKVKFIWAKDEELAMNEIRETKLNGKWIGFAMIGEKRK